jgi:uncharacterized protein (DUF4415 family)
MKKVSRRVAKELAALAHAGRQNRFDGCAGSAGMARRGGGKFYRPIKRPVTIRVDADVLAWFKRQGRGYQTRINKLLREAMEGEAAAGVRGARLQGKNHNPHASKT